MNAASVSAPLARRDSAIAITAGKSGALGWPCIAQLTSSKSSACAAVPLASAARPGELESSVPQSVAPPEPASATTTSRTARVTRSPRAPSAHAKVSSIDARAMRRAASGTRASSKRRANEAISAVGPDVLMLAANL
jgi:hypothetical protein